MPALNLAELMRRASNPAPIVSVTAPAADSTLMAVHMQQSTELAELKKEVDKERTLRQEKEALQITHADGLTRGEQPAEPAVSRSQRKRMEWAEEECSGFLY